MLTLSSSREKPIPVILACDPLPDLWPLSTKRDPFIFRSDATGSSPLKNLLLALSSRLDFAEPLIFAPEAATQTATEQIEKLKLNARTIFVPANHNMGCMAILAALACQQDGKSGPLVFIPGNLRCTDLDAAVESAAILATKVTQWGRSIACVRPVHSPTEIDADTITFEINGRDPLSNLPLARLRTSRGETDDDLALIEMSSLAKDIGVFICQSDHILKHAAKDERVTFEACRKALEMADILGNRRRAGADFLEHAREISLCEIASGKSAEILAFRTDESVGLVKKLTDIPLVRDSIKIGSEQVGSSLIVEGYGDHQIIASPDGILVVKSGCDPQGRKHFDRHVALKPHLSERRTISHWWGAKETICDRMGLEILIRTVKPGSSTTTDLHSRRTASLSVISGRGTITLGDKIINVRPGDHVVVPNQTSYSMASPGGEDLMIAETLTGLNGEEHIVFDLPERRSA